MIICGYQGIGKTTYCKAHPRTSIDWDSSRYEKTEGWALRYVQDALYADFFPNDRVFISAHQDVVQELLKRKISFVLVIPGDSQKAWEARLRFRYESTKSIVALKALRDFQKHYKEDMSFYDSLKDNPLVRIIKISAKIVTNLETFI